ncbi:copper amine oxidase N-terminal domain-containing protein [Rossellomorea aquimaris]|uniref:copper amine oxidase N-terminal domain-containing protein n=1 Tax=Rossellomorea aquimaris TaxID=189382 RepID=UPI001CFF31F5|nr:copper amine oxidase N-terminal domain-containing protein [Rossellomorea aquimaris]
MKFAKRSLAVTVIVFLLSALGSVTIPGEASAASGKLYKRNNINVVIDGKKLTTDSSIYIQDGRILVPMRELFESMDADVYWNKKDLEVTSIKNGKKVVLKIGDHNAYINGSRVSLDVPAILKDYHTYVPLRFVGESFNGKVGWDSQKQEVSVETGNQETFTLHMNNKRVAMDTPPVIKDGRMYMSSAYFLENLDHTDSLWKDKETFEILIDGLSFIFKDEDGTIMVDNEEVSTDLKPFVVNGQMYLPIHFIVNSLGGNLKYKRSTQELYVYLNRYIFNSEFLEKREELMGRPQLVPNASLVGDRRILVSDNPERLTPSVVSPAGATLAQDTIDEQMTSKKHRVFGWNVNDMGDTIKVGITIENLSADQPLTVENARGYSRKSNNGWINYDVGLPMADAMLNDRLSPSLDSSVTIQPGETILVDEYTLDEKYILGFVEDFTVKSQNHGKYIIRTVMGQESDDLTLNHSNAVPINYDAQHPRGVWSSSELETTLPAYTVDSDEVSYSLSNGKTDHLLNSESALDNASNGIPNPGHFGMKYNVKLPIMNQTGQTKKIRIRAAGRGGAYSGAVKIDGKVHLIPTLQPATDTVTILEKEISSGQEQLEIELIHAGGSALPVALYVDTVE